MKRASRNAWTRCTHDEAEDAHVIWLQIFTAVSYCFGEMRGTPTLRVLRTVFILAACLSSAASAADSVWLKAPKPKYPKAALNTFAEGSATVRIIVGRDGKPQAVTVVKSSGNRLFDETARRGAMKWRMDPKKIRASDTTAGRNVIFDFKQEAAVGAVYPDRTAYFVSSKDARIWIYAPFPAYPERARRMRQQGKVMLRIEIGNDGRVANVVVVESSGHSDLDEAALQAARLWRARKEHAGLRLRMPVNFTTRTH